MYRWLVAFLMLAGMAVATAACGPSSAEIRSAKAATYDARPDQMFELAQQAAQETYQIGDVDPENHVFATKPRMYSPEGDLQSPGAGGFIQMDDHSVLVGFLVEIVETDDDHVMVKVTPRTFQFLSGSPKPRELAPDDPNVPPWVHGRVDSLVMAIHSRAQNLEVRSAPSP